MFKEDLSVFFTDFAQPVNYSDGTTSKRFDAIIDHNVELIGFEGESIGTATTFTFKSDSDIVIGGTILDVADSYLIDDIVSDDKSIKVVSVIKQ